VLATVIIVFREVLEAALIVGVVLAASVGVPLRGWWVGGGVVGGVLGASLVAAFATTISLMVEGMGQELFNAAILFAAVVMLGWHNVWMGRHGREMAAEMSSVGAAVKSGGRPLYMLAVVVGIAVLREGSEVVLFLYSIAITGQNQTLGMLGGGVIGLALGVLVGAALYLGLLRIPAKHLFGATSLLITLLAAGMAAQAANFLLQAGYLPALGEQVWDTSWLLSDDGLAGRVLHTLIGYVDRPSGIQLIFYVATIAVIGGLARAVGRTPAARPMSPQPAE
jgi:high-affinity iron transporter